MMISLSVQANLLIFEKEMEDLPKGSIFKRKIGSSEYIYLNYIEGKNVISKLIGKTEVVNIEELTEKIAHRKELQSLDRKIKAFKDIGLLQHVMVIGSWAEYLYPSLFETDLQSVIIRYNDAFFSLSDIYLHIININLIYAKALIPCKNQLFGLVYK